MIPLMKYAFSDEYNTRLKLSEFILSNSQLSMGNKCKEFEYEFSKWQQRKYSILVNSGSSANLLLLQSLLNLNRIQPKDKIGFSSLTWSTNIFPIIQLGLIPVPLDIDVNRLNISYSELESIISEIDVLFITNVLGFTSRLDRIKKLCDDNNVLLIEDNCESLGTEYKGVKTGNFGLASTFSFFVAHHLSTIEGGMVCTDDKELNDMLIMSRANGWDRNLDYDSKIKLSNNRSEFKSKYIFYDLAFNFRPTEITGFIGLEQLKLLDINIDKRNEIYYELSNSASNNDDLIQIDSSDITRLSPFAYPVICKTAKLRDNYINKFAGAGVEIRPVIAGNMLNQPFWRKYYYYNINRIMYNTDIVDSCGFYFGIYPELTRQDIDLLKTLLGSV